MTSHISSCHLRKLYGGRAWCYCLRLVWILSKSKYFKPIYEIKAINTCRTCINTFGKNCEMYSCSHLVSLEWALTRHRYISHIYVLRPLYRVHSTQHTIYKITGKRSKYSSEKLGPISTVRWYLVWWWQILTKRYATLWGGWNALQHNLYCYLHVA